MTDLSSIKIDYIKIVVPYMDDLFISTAYNIGNTFITADVETYKKIFVKTPQEINLNIVSKEALYTVNTTLVTAKYNEPNMTFMLKTPEDLERKQNRKFIRVKAEKDAQISFKNGETIKTLACKTSDISAGGVRITSTEEIPTEQQAEITVDIEGRTVTSKIKYVRTYNTGKFPQVAFEFVDLSPEDIDYICGYCFKIQMQSLNSKQKTTTGRRPLL